MIKVAKFGGSSLADAEHFRKVKAIITADPEDIQKVFSVMNEFNDKYIHLDVSDDER